MLLLHRLNSTPKAVSKVVAVLPSIEEAHPWVVLSHKKVLQKPTRKIIFSHRVLSHEAGTLLLIETGDPLRSRLYEPSQILT